MADTNMALAERKLFGGRGGKKRKDKVDFRDFNAVRVSIASPDKIREWSYGEVKKPETINYRTLKPERDGLFCERIFGPAHDYECACGKYRWIKFKGIVCDRCGVEVTESKVRRERMGHIDLAVPVAHVWFLKKTPSRIGIILNMKTSELERVVYYSQNVVLETLEDESGRVVFKAGQLLNDEEVSKARGEYGAKLKVGIGAGAVRTLLENIDPKVEVEALKKKIPTIQSETEHQKAVRRMRILQGFAESGNRPEWMIFDVLPVIPPELRPLVPLEGGRFATSDLNDLYRRIINRNNRLKHIEALKAPEVMIYNEKRLLQEAVDALIENGARGKVVIGTGNRPLKSLSDILKGKQGRFRQNLLGKRVDYSGRSVIVVGPSLKLHQCGLPKEMALELFKPFIIRELMKKESLTLKAAKRMFDRVRPEIWDILAEITKEHPVMLNRAPTLHRLGIQAFEPVLIEGKSIQLHPLVCAAFNADFDGDQMAVHVPLSPESQLEARMLMLASNNILSPASGKPIAVPAHDMVLGIHYLTKEKDGELGEGRVFSDAEEVTTAFQNGTIGMHSKIKVRGITEIMEEGFSNEKDLKKPEAWKSFTTVGRVLFNQVLPKGIDYINKAMGKKELSGLVDYSYKKLGKHATVELLDNLKEMGFKMATKAGLSISVSDMKIPEVKKDLISKARQQVKKIQTLSRQGIMTESERYNKVIDIWTHVTDEVSDRMFELMQRGDSEPHKEGQPRYNSIFLMANSGARGSRQQVRQLAGMRGLMAKPQKKLTGGVGEIIESPILANFKEGLTVLEYFISTHGGRKGLADTALKTADAGYLTRRLIDVAHDVVVVEEDCGTINGVRFGALASGEEIIEPLWERLIGRVVLEDLVLPGEKTPLVKAGEMVSEEDAEKVKNSDLEHIRVRSVLTCEAGVGVCGKCYGLNLGTGKPVEIGEAVGIVAAQSIGEPGTQLTLRTFHIGGTAARIVKRSQALAINDGKVKLVNMRSLQASDGQTLVVSRTATAIMKRPDKKGDEEIKIPYGARLKIKDGAMVKKEALLAEWDPYAMPIIAEDTGKIAFEDVKEGETLHEERNKITGIIERRIVEHRKRNPRLRLLKAGKEVASYPLPVDTILTVETGQEVNKGETLAKIPQEVSKTKDITGGLPRVAELFEARKPKAQTTISEIEGIVKLGMTAKGNIQVTVRNEETDLVREYSIPHGKHLVVYEGDRVGVGESMTDGPINPHDILAVKGVKEVQEYLVNAIQEVYRLQGVGICDKHIEVIVRQMLQNVKIVDSGDTSLLKGEVVSRFAFARANEEAEKKKGKVAQAEPILLGITKASLASESFVSAASFQETTRVLTEAATTSQVDYLKGLKENVIIGHIIPAGTGLAARRRLPALGLEEGVK